MNTFRLFKLLFFSVFITLSSTAYAGAVFTWTGTSSSSWTDKNNWTYTGDDNDEIPDLDDTVIIPNTGNDPSLPANVTIFRLEMDNGHLNLNGFTLTITTKSYSKIESSTIDFTGGGAIITKTGAADNDLPYGPLLCTSSTFSGGATMTGGLQFHSCTFNGGAHTLNHIGDSHYNGGNTFTGDVTLINEESTNNGNWYWGDNQPDIFNSNLTIQSLSKNRKEIRLADNSAGNIFNGTVTIRTYTGGSVKIAHNTNGTATFEQAVTITNETVDPNGERISYIGYDGTVTFKNDLNLHFTTTGADKAEICIAGNNGDVTFKGNVIIDNDKTNAGRIVRFGDTDKFISVTTKQVHFTGANSKVVLQDFNDGQLYFQYVEKTSTNTQDFSALTTNTKLISKYSDWNGNFTADAGIIHLRENVFQGITNLTNYGSLPVVESQTSHRYSGGNTFKQNATINLGNNTNKDADYDWVWGYYKPDVFEGILTATVETTGPRTLHFSKNATGNHYQNIILTNKENGEIVFGDEDSQTSFISGTIKLNLDGAKYQYFASRGITKFNSDLTADVGVNAPFVQFADKGGSLDFVGSTGNFNINGTTTVHEIDFLTVSGGGVLTLLDDLIITRGLGLTSGNINVLNSTLDIGSSSIYSDADGYVIAENTGVLKMKVANATNATFPLGGSTANSYMPLTINHSQGGTVTFNVKAPTGGATSGLTNYWNISHDKGIFNASLTPNWEMGASASTGDYFMVGQNPSWGALNTSVIANLKGVIQNVTGQANGFLGDFDISTSKAAYAGANQEVSACSPVNLSAIGTGTWSWSDGDITLSSNTDPMATVTVNSSATFPKNVQFTWTLATSESDVVFITFTNSGGGGSPYQVWTNGGGSNKWFDCRNWQGYEDDKFQTVGRSAVPDVSTSAFITGNATTAITTDGNNISCKFLSINNGSKLNLGVGNLNVVNELHFQSAEIFSNKSNITVQGKMEILGTFFNNFITITYADDGTAPAPSFNARNTFSTDVMLVQNSTETNLLFGANHAYMNGGADTFGGNVYLINNKDEELIISNSTTGNTIAGNVIMKNLANGWIRIGNPDYASDSETTLAQNQSIDISSSTSGKVMILRLKQLDGTSSHNLNTSGNVDIYLHSSEIRGSSLMIYGENVEVRESELGSLSGSIFITTNAADTKHCGGNTFYGNTTLNHIGTSPWHWGYTGGDKFKKDVLVINNTTENTAYTFLADKSTDNEFHGTTLITAQGRGAVYIAEGRLTKATFKGKTYFLGERDIIYSGGDGRGLDAINVAEKGSAVFEDDMTAKFSNAGTTLSALGTPALYMSFAYDSGTIEFDDIILEDETGTNRRRGFYFGTPKNTQDNNRQTNATFDNQVILNGGISITDTEDFLNSEIYLSNLTQKTATAINLPVKNAIVLLRNSELKGSVNIDAKSAAYRWNYFGGATNLSIVNPTNGDLGSSLDYNGTYQNFACGGNYFANTSHIIYNTNYTNTATQWQWGTGLPWIFGADTFALASIFENKTTKLLEIGNATQGNKFYSDLTLTNSGQGTIELGNTALSPGQTNVSVKGNTIFNNQSTTSTNTISVAKDGIFEFGGNLTTQSSGGEIHLAYGGTATDGWIASKSLMLNATGTQDTTTTQTLNFNTNKTILHKLESGSTRLSLASNVDFVTTDTNAHLRFTTGQISVNNFDMNLNQGQLTAPNGGTAKGDFKESNVIAAGIGHFKRYIPLNSATLLPLANPSSYYPAILTFTTANDIVGGRIGSLLSDSYSNTNEPNGNLIRNYFTSVSWILVKDDNTVNSDFTLDLQWNGTSDELPDFDRTKANINRYNTFVTSVWQCAGLDASATNNGDGTFSLSNTYSGLQRMGIFAPTSPYVNAGNDVVVQSCTYGALSAHLLPGTGGVGQWAFVTIIANATTEPSPRYPNAVTTEVDNVEDNGQYVFKWTVQKADVSNTASIGGCTTYEDFVTITTKGTSVPTSTPGPFTYWTGLSTIDPTDWYDCSNWLNGIPGFETEVFISATATAKDYPVLDNSISIKKLHIFEGGEIDLNGYEVTIENDISFNTATVKGNGSFRVIPKVLSVSDIFDITNVSFTGDIILEADRFDIGFTTFQGALEIAKIGNDEDRWKGGNQFNSASITLATNTNLYLATQVGNVFTNNMEANIETASGNIYFTTAFITTSFEGHVYLRSTKRASDFDFGAGTIAFTGYSNWQTIYNELNGYNLWTDNFILNKRDWWRRTRLESDELVIRNHLKLQKGLFRIGWDWHNPATIRMKNPDPDALILERGGTGDPEPYQAAIDVYTSYRTVFSRMVDFSRVDEYHYPIYTRPISIIPDGTGAGSTGNVQEMNLQTYWWIRPQYRDDNIWTGNWQETNDEYVYSSWNFTQTNKDASGNVKVKMFWRNNEERQNVDRSAMFPITYNYDTDKWECIGLASKAGEVVDGDPDGNGTLSYFITSTVNVPDFTTTSTNFGIFGIASAKANTDNTDAFQTVRECLAIQLDATRYLESPIGGEWSFVSASSNMQIGVNPMVTADVVFSSATDPETYVSTPAFTPNTSETYLMVFRWVRKSTGACSDGSELNDDFVTVTITKDASLTKNTTLTWTGAANHDWMNCANWSDGVPDGTTTKIIIPGVVNHAQMPNPNDTNIDFITSLEIVNGGGLDLNGQNIIVQFLTIDNAFTTGFYTGAIIHEFDKAYVGVPYTTASYDFMTGNFISVTRTFQVRKSTFHNNIGFAIDRPLIHERGDPWRAVSYNGGNTFKDNTIIDYYSDYPTVWGWNDHRDLGGPDVFEGNLQVRTHSPGCGGPICPYVVVPWRHRHTREATNYPTNFDINVDWFSPEFYIPEDCCTDCNAGDSTVNANSITLCANYTSPTVRQTSGRGRGFDNYPRFDTRRTNTGNPDLDKVNTALNEDAKEKNQADLDLNIANIDDAQDNVDDAYSFVTAAWADIELADNRATDMLQLVVDISPAFDTSTSACTIDGSTATDSEMARYRTAIQDLNNAVVTLNNTLANGGCGSAVGILNTNSDIKTFMTAVMGATLDAKIGVDLNRFDHDVSNVATFMNSPGDDNLKAITANVRANQATACAKLILEQIIDIHNKLRSAASSYNRMLVGRGSDNLLYFAYNTQGTDFQDSTQFYVEDCSRIRIADTNDAKASFTGNLKKHDFVNRSIRGDALILANREGTYVEFSGGNSRTNALNHNVGRSYYANRGQIRWVNSDTLNISNTGIPERDASGNPVTYTRDANGNYAAGATFIGGSPWQANLTSTSRADLDGELIIDGDSLTNGNVYLVNFNQNSQQHEVAIEINHKGRFEIWGKSNFSSNVSITNRGVDYIFRNVPPPSLGAQGAYWTNRSTAVVGWYNSQSDITFNGLLSLKHKEGKQKYYDFETNEAATTTTPNRQSWRTRNYAIPADQDRGAASGSNFHFHRMGKLHYNGGVLIENELRDRYNRRRTYFGDFGYDGYGEVPDTKGFRIGTEGFRSGYLEITRLYKKGEGKQLLIMSPDIILPEGKPYIHPDFGVAQKTSTYNAVLRVEDCTFEGEVNIEAPQLGVRSNRFDGETKIVSYGGDGGYVSGGNTFNTVATFELRSMEDFNGRHTRNGKWILGNGIPDIYRGDIVVNNYGMNSMMGIATHNDPKFVTVDNMSEFEGKVTIHNRPVFWWGNNVRMYWHQENVGTDIGRVDYRWTDREYIPNTRFLIGGYRDAKALFKEEVTIINETKDYDVEIAGYKDNKIQFKKGIKITNKYPNGYTPTAGCLDYKGDVKFGMEDASTSLMVGGFTTVDEGITVENFVDGLLELNAVAITSPSANALLSFDMADQLVGDLGKGRLHIGFCSINQKVEARARWVRSNSTHYGQDVNFERTDGNCDAAVEWRAKNIYEGDFRLLDKSTNTGANLILAAYGNDFIGDTRGDIYKGFATFESETGAKSAIVVADKFISEFADNITLQFNTITPLNNTTNMDTENPLPDKSTTSGTAGWFAGIKVIGSGEQQLSSSHPVYVNRLQVEQENGSSTLDLDQEMTILVRAHFEKGKVVLGKRDVNLENSKNPISVSVQYPNEGHFVANSEGTLNRMVFPVPGIDVDGLKASDGLSVLFPIGNLTNYLPATITLRPNFATADMFRARLIDDVYTSYDGRWDTGIKGGNPSFVPSDDSKYAPSGSPTSIDRNFVRRSWVITEDTRGGSEGTLMLQWYEGDANVATDEPPGFDRTKTTIVHYQADSDEWRCMEELAAAKTSSDGLVRKRTFVLNTEDDNDEITKMGVFSIGSLTAGEDNEVSTCGAGAAQLTAAPLSPPLSGEWDFITVYHDETGLFIPPDVFDASYTGSFTTIEEHELSKTYDAAKYPEFNTALSYSDITDPNGVIYGLEANKVYMFKWQPSGLKGSCTTDFLTVLVRTGGFTTATTNKALVWQGADPYFWDCNNWQVEGDPGNYALPNETMDLIIPFVTIQPTQSKRWFPEFYDKFPNLTVKSIRVQEGASFTVGGKDHTTNYIQNAGGEINPGNLKPELTVIDFITVHQNANFINRFTLNVKDSIHNEGTFKNTPYFITSTGAYSTPRLEITDFSNRGTNSKFEVGSGSLVFLNGNLTNEGEIFHTIGTMYFQSATSFITGGSPIYLRQVFLQKDNATDSLVIANTNVFITADTKNLGQHFLQFDNGKIYTYSKHQAHPYTPSLLAFMSGTLKKNSNENRYVAGPVSKYFDNEDDDFEYPIGKGYWARARLSDVEVINPDFVTAEYFAGGFTATGVQHTTQRPLDHVSKLEYWRIDPSGVQPIGNLATRVSLYWESGVRSGIKNAPNFSSADPYQNSLVIVHMSKDFDNNGTEEQASSKWLNEGGLDGAGGGGSTVSSGVIISHDTKKIRSFSPFTIGTPESPSVHPLPVEWLYVQAKLIDNGKESLVQWGTSTELNNDYFEIQRSTDGKNFVVIGIQEATNLGNGSDYAWIDKTPNVGVNYYRIRQVDYNGDTSFSKIVSIKTVPVSKRSRMTVYPNPTHPNNVNLSIYSNLEGTVNIRFFDAIGQQVFTKTIELREGQNEVDISPRLFIPKGVYIISADELFLRSKLIIE